MPEPKVTVAKLREQRMQVQRDIADAFQAQNRYYADYVRPHAATAKLGTGGGKTITGAGASTLPLSLERADLLDRSTPSGAFEFGRAYMEHYNAIIRRLRTREKQLTTAIDRIREDEVRAAMYGSRPLELPVFISSRLRLLSHLMAEQREP